MVWFPNDFVPRPRTEAAKRAFSYRWAVVWNGLGNKLKDDTYLNSFKSALTAWNWGELREFR